MLTEALLQEQKSLQEIRLKAQEDLLSAPKGSLRIINTTKKPQYYHRIEKSDRAGTYLKNDQVNIACALAQKEYAQSIIQLIDCRLKYIDAILEEYKKGEIKNYLKKYNPARQNLIHPYILSDEEFSKQWLSTAYEGNLKFPENKLYTTANCEMVRSKSEMIIADTLLRLGIPYKYEALLRLSGNVCFYPDFTILNVKQRKLVYLEHFGMLDDQEYRNNFFNKLSLFQKNGLVLGDNLIITLESSTHPFNISLYIDEIKHCCL